MSIAGIAISAAANLLGNVFGQTQASSSTQASNTNQPPNAVHHHHHHSGGSDIAQTGTAAANNGLTGLLNTIV